MKLRVLFMAVLMCFYAAAAMANVPLMPVSDLRPGMQGVGKTVISGDTIESFNVEILGVSGSQTSGYSIFAHLSGDVIDRTGGVAQGMSGSPVYVDGRLVGAVAFGKVFNDPHYCFLTPIGNMLPLVDEPRRLPYDWIPKSSGLLAGGFSAYGIEYLKEKLQPMGLEVLGSSGGAGETGTGALEPGSAVAVSVMQGDMTLGALGTVTWTDDEGRILAFGHPFMQRGDCSFFMNKVWVLGCVPNLQSSYKVGNIGEAVGTVTQDRASGVGGRTGRLPAAVPLHISTSDLSRGVNDSMQLRIVDDEQLLPALTDAAVVNAVSRTFDRSGGGTARVHFKITGTDSKKKMLVIDRENMYYVNEGLMKVIPQELTEAAGVLMQNKFEKVDLYGIDVETEVSDAVQVAEVTRVSAKKSTVRPGEKIELAVVMKPYRGEEFTKIVTYKVPDDCRGRLMLNVRGGSSMSWIQELLRKQKEDGIPSQRKDDRRTLADYVKSVNEADKNNELIIDIAAAKPNPAMVQEDAGLAGMLQGSRNKQKYTFDFIIDGSTEISFAVE